MSFFFFEVRIFYSSPFSIERVFFFFVAMEMLGTSLQLCASSW